jgi:hypothetical protein
MKQTVMVRVQMDPNDDDAVDHLIYWLEDHDSYTAGGWVVLELDKVAAWCMYVVERRLAGHTITCLESGDPELEDPEYDDQGGAA